MTGLQRRRLAGSCTSNDSASARILHPAPTVALMCVRPLVAPPSFRPQDPTMLSLGIGANNQPTFGSDLPAPQITDSGELTA